MFPFDDIGLLDVVECETLRVVRLAVGEYPIPRHGQVVLDLPGDVVTNIQLYGQHMEEDDRAYALEDSISKFVTLDFNELIDMNDLDGPDAGEAEDDE